jgi:hypothetical protein
MMHKIVAEALNDELTREMEILEMMCGCNID